MGGKSRAAMRREKKRKQKGASSTSLDDVAAVTASGKPQKRQQKTIYDSDSDSSDDTNRAAAIPLPSLEDGDKVRDFVKELETQHKPTGKRARAEAEQHAVDQRKKRFREEKAEKIVWRKFDRENRAFEKFYERCLGLDKDEFARFLACLKEPLPVHLRVNGNYTSLSEIVTGSLELDFDLREVTVPTPVGGGEMHVQFGPEAWAPEKRLWKLSVDSKMFRKVEGLRSLSTYVRAQGSLGTLLRQDPAATVLPAFLDVQPGQRVLDLCGGGEHRAPIVKEYLCPGSPASAGIETSSSAKNVLVVNERDATVAASAVRNLTRTLPLACDLIVSAHKPEDFPVPGIADALFDRVICCAPCSGDGLIRKLPEKWRTWSPEQALVHHPSQLGLAEHAVSLLRTGGALLYSTRSLNPIENEAVVAELLRRSNGALELVETDDILEGLERSHGLSQWDVLDLASWDDASEDQRHRLRPSMWPPSNEECDEMHLDRCVRLLPHQNDTHGLFLAVIRKTREADNAVVAVGPALPQSKTKTKSNVSKNKKQAKAEKPFGSFTPIGQEHLASIRSFFALRSSSAFLERANMARQKRAVHVVTPAVAELVTNQLRGRLSIYHAGVFALRPGTGVEAVADELTDDGARTLLPEMNKRVLNLPQDEFTSFLESREMWLKNAGEHAREQLAQMTEGSLAVALDDMEPAQTGDRDIVLVAVKRHNSCSIVSSPAAIARIKALLEELNDTGGDEDGYDSFEFEDE
ncbi:tRNA (cytosine-5-)-methyltransferase NSUN2-like protein [Phytophthora infestans T30-4]|uniref:tRNA (Cytosine-5-)-methyltransferase NSUN2-like protein n=1 Tax=Phytophthora infestans (strain T30-4) TaxID=403677 RepID=D0MWM7_PHYIT|nr:tRNA (cytosine-5-)-methyltransferase NSUN2-like protein [Phytophthora infestans T30-4]EEY64040.1 tRNA (cytosine-5-)-methyltransferase NSUN2-like protein [Phytophthora infestans T30-4]|eukprot:XP_002907476.1 tRNA (cytosine-5-)-methyltransferase NSUN2-like protein [Phytophthora infestans T30-4]